MSDAYNKIIALIRAQNRQSLQFCAYCGVLKSIKPLTVEIMGEPVDGIILAQGVKCTAEDIGARLLCLPADIGLVAISIIGG